MSISSLVDRFGRLFYVIQPTYTKQTDGTIKRDYQKPSRTSAFGWFQPSGQSGDVFEGRQNSRTTGTIYFKGAVSVAVDDEITTTETDGVQTFFWRVVGATYPGDLRNSPLVAPHLSMTVVEVVEVDPKGILDAG